MPSEAPARDAPSPEQRKQLHPVLGYLCVAAAAFLWGASATLGKAVFTGLLGKGAAPLNPLILAQSRTTLSLLALIPLLFLFGQRARLKAPFRVAVKAMGVGALGIAISNYAYYLAIEKTSVATAIVLQYIAPVWVLLYFVLFRHLRVGWQKVTAVGLAVVGSALAIGMGSGEELAINPVGLLAAEVAAIAFAYYNIAGGALVQKHDRWAVLTYALAGAALFWLVVNPPWKVVQAGYSGEQWLFLGVFAATSMLLPFSFYFAGLQYLDATRAIVTSCLEPVFAILLAVMFVGERLGALQIVGVGVVLAATVIVQLGPSSASGR